MRSYRKLALPSELAALELEKKNQLDLLGCKELHVYLIQLINPSALWSFTGATQYVYSDSILSLF